MDTITLRRPENLTHWLRVYRLYRSAFPRSERKPFGIILRQIRNGIFDVWCICQADRFTGLAIIMKQEKLVLVDYLAVAPKSRGQGIGSGALVQLRRLYEGKDLFLEIESVYEDTPDRPQRQRRKTFYLRCGLTPMEVMVRLFGVPMELMGFGCRIDFDQYRNFYRSCMGSWFASRISSLPYPTTQNQEE